MTITSLDQIQHGSITAYSMGCHCEKCRAGWAAYMRDLRQRHRKEILKLQAMEASK